MIFTNITRFILINYVQKYFIIDDAIYFFMLARVKILQLSSRKTKRQMSKEIVGLTFQSNPFPIKVFSLILHMLQ